MQRAFRIIHSTRNVALLDPSVLASDNAIIQRSSVVRQIKRISLRIQTSRFHLNGKKCW